MHAYRIAGLLRYAALQFIVLSALAMAAYAGGTWFDPYEPRYQVAGNFLSDLGMTHSFSGRANYVSCVLFAVALVSVGGALAAFAWTWRSFAFGRGRLCLLGQASTVLGTAAGLAFIGVALTPFDIALAAHIGLVVAAFGLLALYVAALTVVMWRNAAPTAWLATNTAYLALVAGYVAFGVLGSHAPTPHDHALQVISQKVVAYASMLHAAYVATMVRRAGRRPAAAAP